MQKRTNRFLLFVVVLIAGGIFLLVWRMAPSDAREATPVLPTTALPGETAVPATLEPTLTPTITQTPSPTPTWTPLPTATPAPTLTATPTVLPVGQADRWTLVFRDEFESSQLDESIWHTCYWWEETACTIASNNEKQVYMPENVSVRDGALVLTANRQSLVKTSGRSYAYTSGMVSTGRESDDPRSLPGYSFQYGYVEIRAKIPAGQGLWPAFWLLPITNESKPEIDVMEILGHRTDTVEMHYHYRDRFGGTHRDGDDWTGPDFANGWHTYAVDWQPSHIIWYVDGVERLRFAEEQFVSHEPMYLIMNLAVGGNWGGDPDGTTRFPSEYLVDYIRVWQHSSSETIEVVEDSYIDQETPGENFGAATEIRSDGESVKTAYLKFDTGMYEGREILAAVLSISTAGERGSGSSGVHDVILVPDSSWSEHRISAEDAPAEAGVVVGRIAHPEADNNTYRVALDAGVIQDMIGRVFTLRIETESLNGLYLRSKESDLGGASLMLVFRED